MDSELEARFRNMTPLYEADPHVQTELVKLLYQLAKVL